MREKMISYFLNPVHIYGSITLTILILLCAWMAVIRGTHISESRLEARRITASRVTIAALFLWWTSYEIMMIIFLFNTAGSPFRKFYENVIIPAFSKKPKIID